MPCDRLVWLMGKNHPHARQDFASHYSVAFDGMADRHSRTRHPWRISCAHLVVAIIALDHGRDRRRLVDCLAWIPSARSHSRPSDGKPRHKRRDRVDTAVAVAALSDL